MSAAAPSPPRRRKRSAAARSTRGSCGRCVANERILFCSCLLVDLTHPPLVFLLYWQTAAYRATRIRTSPADESLRETYCDLLRLTVFFDLAYDGSFLLFTVTFYANHAHNLTRSP